jgi:chromosome condensin MukBEF complex kleisin-like MukF subunit
MFTEMYQGNMGFDEIFQTKNTEAVNFLETLVTAYNTYLKLVKWNSENISIWFSFSKHILRYSRQKFLYEKNGLSSDAHKQDIRVLFTLAFII